MWPAPLAEGFNVKKFYVRETQNLSTCADNSTNTKIFPNWTEMDKKGQKLTEIDRNQPKPTDTDRESAKEPIH